MRVRGHEFACRNTSFPTSVGELTIFELRYHPERQMVFRYQFGREVRERLV
jgi:hypothetical protein